MTSDFAAHPRRTPAPADTTADALVLPDPTSPRDIWLRPGNLVEIGDALGAQMFSVVDGEVTFVVRSADHVRRWRGHLDAQGLVEL